MNPPMSPEGPLCRCDPEGSSWAVSHCVHTQITAELDLRNSSPRTGDPRVPP